MFKISIKELEEKAYSIRADLIDLHYQAGSGHLDTSLSLVEVWLAIVYSDFFQHDPSNGAWADRDRIYLSEGHACPLQYMATIDLGYGSRDELFAGFRKPGTPYQGHTQRNLVYGLENSNGSLGIGSWQAYGTALETERNVFCIVGDGEMEEPSSLGVLAAPNFMKAPANLTILLNYNRLAQDDTVDLGPIASVAEVYGWGVVTVDGHDFQQLGEAYQNAVDDKVKPYFIICNTTKGKGGAPQWAGQLGWHGRPPQNEEEYQAYVEGLKATRRD